MKLHMLCGASGLPRKASGANVSSGASKSHSSRKLPIGLLSTDGGFSARLFLGLAIDAPGDHRAARARHPDAIALDAGIQLATVFVLADEGFEGGAEGVQTVHRA